MPPKQPYVNCFAVDDYYSHDEIERMTDAELKEFDDTMLKGLEEEEREQREDGYSNDY